MKKKFLALLLVLVMVLTLLPTGALAATSDFVIQNGVLTKYVGRGGSVTIPDGVTCIGKDAFASCFNLTKVIIPNGVTSIGEQAFWYCRGLTSVTIPNTVTEIEEQAFQGCNKLTSLTIPNSVTTIGRQAFRDCAGLTSLSMGNGLTSIGQNAFSGCKGLTNVTIGSGVTTIGEYAISNCDNLASVTIPNGVTTIGDGAFFNCPKLTSVTIPSSVTHIGNGVFAGDTREHSVAIQIDKNNPAYIMADGVLFTKDMKTLVAYPEERQGAYVIPNSVTSIQGAAFYHCTGLTDVTIPASVASIGVSAFRYCSSLTNVTIPGGITCIEDSTFEGSGLTSATIPESVTRIKDYAFASYGGLKDVYYTGTQEQWHGITIDNDAKSNRAILSATIHYNSTAPAFTDAVAGEYYIEPIDWAVKQNIVLGYDDGRFGVGDACEQAHILTFLWRSQNKPEPTIANPYAALDTNEYYAKAAIWAYEKGLITDRNFNFGAVCTRKDVVTYLWKLAGSPRTGAANSFTDVPTGLADAVNWAASKGVTQGVGGGLFGTNDPCTREQIVTFLYRAYK